MVVLTDGEPPPDAEAFAKVRYHAVHSFPHPSNASVERSVTLSGIVTFVSSLQPENAEDPMLVTLSGIVTFVSPLQP